MQVEVVNALALVGTKDHATAGNVGLDHDFGDSLSRIHDLCIAKF